MTTNVEEKHTNAASKSACGKRDWKMLRIVEGLAPDKALGTVEWLILKAVTDNDWRSVTYTSEQMSSPSFCDRGSYIQYWKLLADEVYGCERNGTTISLLANRLFDLIEQVRKGGRLFDTNAMSIMGEMLIDAIVNKDCGNSRLALWRRFTELGSQHDWGAELLKNLERSFTGYSSSYFSPIVVSLIAAMDRERLGSSSFTGKAVRIFWKSFANHQTEKLVDFTAVIGPLCEITDIETIIACQQAVGKICKFRRSLATLEPVIQSLGLRFERKIKMNFHLEDQVLFEITVRINNGHFDLFGKSVRDQKKIIDADRVTLMTRLAEWTNEHGIRNFKVSIVGTLKDTVVSRKPADQAVEEHFTAR